MSKLQVGDKVICISRHRGSSKASCGKRLDNNYKIGDILTIAFVFYNGTLGIKGTQWKDDQRNFSKNLNANSKFWKE